MVGHTCPCPTSLPRRVRPTGEASLVALPSSGVIKLIHKMMMIEQSTGEEEPVRGRVIDKPTSHSRIDANGTAPPLSLVSGNSSCIWNRKSHPF